MALSNAYLVSSKNLEAFLVALVKASAPERFTAKFLEGLGFASSNDRMFIGLLKSLGFIDENGVPTQRYFNYLDETQSKQVLAVAIREAYADLFVVNKKAYEMTQTEVKNKLKTLTQGKKTDNVVALMASTFVKLSELADWSSTPQPEPKAQEPGPDQETSPTVDTGDVGNSDKKILERPLGLHYNIQIHLPESRDPQVYDAIFSSLKRHL